MLITGGTVGGLGVESALTIAAHDPKLIILTARSQAKFVPLMPVVLVQSLTTGSTMPLLRSAKKFLKLHCAAFCSI